MKKIILLVAVIPILCISQQTYVPDNSFEQELINLGYDNVLDDSVLTINIDTVTQLTVSFKNITDITGIEDFTALTDLYCGYNQLISFDISHNIALTDLSCWGNQLTNLDISQNTALTYLHCNSNQLTSLDVSNNTALTNLQCSDNLITNLNLSQNTALTSVMCFGNQLSCLNVRNGNNINIPDGSFNASINLLLTCIEVDDLVWSTTNWTNIDVQSSFSTNCNNLCSLTSIQENTINISIFPNPTNDLITLEIEGYNGPFDVEVYDLNRRLLETTKSRTISLKKYSKGIYVFRVSYGDRTQELRVLRD